MFFKTTLLLAAASLSAIVSADLIVGGSNDADCNTYGVGAGSTNPTEGTCYIWQSIPNHVLVKGLADDASQAVHFFSDTNCSDLQLSVQEDGCNTVDGMGVTAYKLM